MKIHILFLKINIWDFQKNQIFEILCFQCSGKSARNFDFFDFLTDTRGYAIYNSDSSRISGLISILNSSDNVEVQEDICAALGTVRCTCENPLTKDGDIYFIRRFLEGFKLLYQIWHHKWFCGKLHIIYSLGMEKICDHSIFSIIKQTYTGTLKILFCIDIS